MSRTAREVVELYNLVVWNQRDFALADELLGDTVTRHEVGEVHVLTQLRGIAPDHRPDEPIERSKSFWPAGAVGRRTYPGLKFPQRRVCIRSEDAVGSPGVEPEFHQSSL